MSNKPGIRLIKPVLAFFCTIFAYEILTFSQSIIVKQNDRFLRRRSNHRGAKRSAYHNFIFKISGLLMFKTLWPLFTRILTVTLLLIYEGILTPTQPFVEGLRAGVARPHLQDDPGEAGHPRGAFQPLQQPASQPVPSIVAVHDEQFQVRFLRTVPYRMIPKPAIRAPTRATRTLVSGWRMLAATRRGTQDQARPVSIGARARSAIVGASALRAKANALSGTSMAVLTLLENATGRRLRDPATPPAP